MLRSTVQRLERRLLEHEWTRPAVEVFRANALCRRPARGSAAQIQARLLALTTTVGLDRLPFGIVICTYCGKRACMNHEIFLKPEESCLLLRSRLAGWLESLNAIVGDRRPAHPRRILLFSVMPHWIDYCLPLALALAGRDCIVDYLWLPYLVMHRDHPEDLLSRTTTAHWSVPPYVRLHPRFRLVNLLHVPPGPVNTRQEEIARSCARIDTQYYLCRERLDEQDEEVRSLFEFRRQRNLTCLARLRTWLKTNRYDSALIPNAVSYEFAAVYQWLRHVGLDVVTFDFGERKGVIYPSDGEPAVYLDTRSLWAADEPHVLTAEREQRIMNFLMRREMPNWQDSNYLWQGQTTLPREAGALCAELKLDPGRPIVLLCTNLAHDSAVLGMTRTFSSMAEWISETVGWFRDRPEWQLIVRCHPAELLSPSSDPVPEMLAAHYGELPENIHIIRPEDKVNTYGLIRLCRFGLMYTTTVGLEMAVRGYQVVTAGKAHYTGKGFTLDPKDRAEYFAVLERLTAEREPVRLTPREVELARCYADTYFFRYSRPVMWYNPGRTEEDMARCSLEQLLRGDCPPEFLETLDFFAGRGIAARQAGRKAG
jgi:hypothetical protein